MVDRAIEAYSQATGYPLLELASSPSSGYSPSARSSVAAESRISRRMTGGNGCHGVWSIRRQAAAWQTGGLWYRIFR